MIAWDTPLYYIGSAVVLLNIIRCIVLVRSKSQILAIQEHAKGIAAIEQVENVQGLIMEARGKSLSLSLERLEKAIQNRGTSEEGSVECDTC